MLLLLVSGSVTSLMLCDVFSYLAGDRQISEPSTDLRKKNPHIGSAFSAAAVKIFSAASSRGN